MPDSNFPGAGGGIGDGTGGTGGAVTSGDIPNFESIAIRDTFFNESSHSVLLKKGTLIWVDVAGATENIATSYRWFGDDNPSTYLASEFRVSPLGSGAGTLYMGHDGAEISSGATTINMKDAYGGFHSPITTRYSVSGGTTPFNYDRTASTLQSSASVFDTLLLESQQTLSITAIGNTNTRAYAVRPGTVGELRVQVFAGTDDTAPPLTDTPITIIAGDIGNVKLVVLHNELQLETGKDLFVKFSGVRLFGGLQTSGAFNGQTVVYLDTDFAVLTPRDLAINGDNVTFGTGTFTDDLTVDVDTFRVDASEDMVIIGALAPGLTDLTIFQGSNNTKGLTLSGKGVTGSSVTTEGISLLAGNVQAGNNQLWFVNTADLNASAKNSFRGVLGIDIPTFSGVNNTGITSKNIGFGGDGANIGVAFGFSSTAVQADVKSKVHIKTGVTTEIGLIVQCSTSQTADLFQTRDNLASVLTVINKDGNLGVRKAIPSAALDVFGDTHLEFTATASDTHAVEVIVNAAGFGDVKAISLCYVTGNLPVLDDNAIILINIDESQSTNGELHALEVLTTSVQLNTNKVGVKIGIGIDPIHQDSGVFGNAASILVNTTTQLTALSSGGAGNIPVFSGNNDTITIGKATKFEEIEIIIDTPASGGGVSPLFEFSTGVGAWTAFSPTDGTNGFRTTGIIAFEVLLITGWATGLNSEFLIRITRTRTTIPNTPILDLIQLATATIFSWDKDGNIILNNITATQINSTTLITPTIASFTNAKHTHSNDAGGGTLVAAVITDFDTQVRTNKLDQMAVPTTSVSFNGQLLTNLLDPTSLQDAATKNYVDSHTANAMWTKSGTDIFQTTLTDNVGLGLNNPTARLHLAGGASTLAPLKLTNGAFLTTLQDGAFEYDGDIEKLTFTSGLYREQLNKRLSPEVAIQSVKTWTSRAAEANDWRHVTWSPELGIFVAVTESGTNRVMTSPDGINWTARVAAAAIDWNGITWSPELGIFAAVSLTGGTQQVMTSPDGITWSLQTTPNANNTWSAITWSPELTLFVAVAQSSTKLVMTSPDGITWTEQTESVANQWQSVVWSPELGLFVAVASTGTGDRVMTSPDGSNWTTQASASDNSWRDITWSPELGLFAAVSGFLANRVMTSPDGITWTGVPVPDGGWLGIIWSPELGLFVGVGSSGANRVMTSPDGITWTFRPESEPSTWQSVAWSPELGIFAVVASAGTNRVMTSEPPAAFSQFSTVTAGEIFDGDGQLNATSENVIPVFKESDFGVASGGAITLAANKLYRLHAPIVMANVLVFQSNTRLDSIIGAVNSLTYSSTGGTFISGFAAAGTRLENITIISTGGSATLFNLSGLGSMTLSNFDAVNFANPGTISDFILLNADNFRFTGFTTGLTLNNVANITALVYAFISSATPSATSALRITGKNTTSVFLLIATMVNTAPANNFFISPTINDTATVRINNTATVGTGDFFEAGTSGIITGYANNDPAVLFSVVLDAAGIAEFTAGVNHNFSLDDLIINIGWPAYDGTFIVSKVVDNLRYQLSSLAGVPIPFTSEQSGSAQRKIIQVTTSAPHTLANDTPIQITLSSLYNGNYNISNASGSVFDIVGEFTGASSGDFSSGSIDKTEPRMQVSSSSPEENSTVAGGWHASGTPALTTVAVAYGDFVLPATRLRFSYNERILYVSQINGEIEYSGSETISITVPFSITMDPDSGGTSVSVVVKLVIDKGAGYVDLPDLVETELFFKGTNTTSNLNRKVTLKTGDKVKWQIRRPTSGGVTDITVIMADIMI